MFAVPPAPALAPRLPLHLTNGFRVGLGALATHKVERLQSPGQLSCAHCWVAKLGLSRSMFYVFLQLATAGHAAVMVYSNRNLIGTRIRKDDHVLTPRQIDSPCP